MTISVFSGKTSPGIPGRPSKDLLSEARLWRRLVFVRLVSCLVTHAVSIHRGSPKNGRFITENPTKLDDSKGYPHGNLGTSAQATGDRSHSVQWRPASGGGKWKPVDPASQVGSFALSGGMMGQVSGISATRPGGKGQLTGGAREPWSKTPCEG